MWGIGSFAGFFLIKNIICFDWNIDDAIHCCYNSFIFFFLKKGKAINIETVKCFKSNVLMINIKSYQMY